MNKKASCALVFIIAFCFKQLTAQPPATYDLREHNLVTSIKAQKSGTCWAHATASGLESNIILTLIWHNSRFFLIAN